MSDTPLFLLRAHVDQWGGLNAADATMLLDLLEGKGARTEYGFPIDAHDGPESEVMRTIEPWHIEFIDHRQAIVDPPWDDDRKIYSWAGLVWSRVVGPWQQLGR